MRFANQRSQAVAPRRSSQIDMYAQLAAARIGDVVDVGQVGRIHQHHVGAVGSQRAPGHRAGEDARQIEHSKAAQRGVAGCMGWPRPAQFMIGAFNGLERQRGLVGEGSGPERVRPTGRSCAPRRRQGRRPLRRSRSPARASRPGPRPPPRARSAGRLAGPATSRHHRGDARSWRGCEPSRARRSLRTCRGRTACPRSVAHGHRRGTSRSCPSTACVASTATRCRAAPRMTPIRVAASAAAASADCTAVATANDEGRTGSAPDRSMSASAWAGSSALSHNSARASRAVLGVSEAITGGASPLMPG
jgi:hypothetical protein